MSASLVGSEMCIRDSPSTCASPQARPPRGQWSRYPWLQRALPPRTPGPVSYTHLTLPTICSV
eukprot:14862865-Alexandrium_andersonii.AAC.1